VTVRWVHPPYRTLGTQGMFRGRGSVCTSYCGERGELLSEKVLPDLGLKNAQESSRRSEEGGRSWSGRESGECILPLGGGCLLCMQAVTPVFWLPPHKSLGTFGNCCHSEKSLAWNHPCHRWSQRVAFSTVPLLDVTGDFQIFQCLQTSPLELCCLPSSFPSAAPWLPLSKRSFHSG
jgi:hypothetical protein